MKRIFNSQYFFITILLIFYALLLLGAFCIVNVYIAYTDIIISIIAFIMLFVLHYFIREARLKAVIYNKLVIGEESLRETFNSLNEGIIITDIKGIIQNINPSAEKLTLWKVNETIGLPLEKIYDILNAQTGEPFDNIVGRIIKEGRTIEFENNTILRKKNAHEIIISNSGTPIRNSDGSIIGVVLVFRDITEQKQLSREKKELTNRLHLATKSAQMGVWDWDIKNESLKWDEGMCFLFDVKDFQPSNVYEHWISRIHTEDKNNLLDGIQEVLKTKEKEYNAEHRVVWTDSSIHYIKSRGTIERNEEGVAIRMIGVNWDITESKIVEEKLRRSEKFNKAVLNSLSSHIAVVNRDGTIVAVSESWSRFGIDNAIKTNTMVGANYFNVCLKSGELGDELALEALNGMLAVMEEREMEFHLEYPCHSPDEKRWFIMTVTKFEIEESMIVVEHKNITEKKLAEQELERINYDLMQRNKNMEQFSYIVSHNLRAPVANILGFTELLKMKNSNAEDIDSIMNGLFRAAFKLDDVIRDLNDILQIRTQVLENKEYICFDDIVGEISLSIDTVIKNHNVIIRTDFKSIDRILAIRRYIYSIFYNLIYNSIKYQKPGEYIFIEVKSQRTQNGLILTFKDNGLGMDLEKQGDKIFGLYKRFHLHTEGKGLGLFMVRRQVEALGGRIKVVSEVNNGAEFIIEFDNIDIQ